MTKETENPTCRYQALHLHMISTVEACLYQVRDMSFNTQGLRINASTTALADVQHERNMLIALLGELNASMKKMAALEGAVIYEGNVLRSINKLKERVNQAKDRVFKTHFDVSDSHPFAQAS